VIESLETRRLFATTYVNGVLTYLGTAQSDTFDAFQNATHLVVTHNGVTAYHKLQGLARLAIEGGDSADSIIVSSRTVTIPVSLAGGRGSDTISAAKGNDTLFGGPGDDYMYGAEGNDLLDGNSGADDFLGGPGNRDIASYFARTNAVTVGLGNFPDDGEVNENDNVRTDIEMVYGGAGNDQLSTTGGQAVRLFGFAGNDTLIGSLGADLLEGGSGEDSMKGNGGNDYFVANEGSSDILDGGSGVDTAESDSSDTLIEIP
jgi:Ca2+-binding RTX toxin-like protein